MQGALLEQTDKFLKVRFVGERFDQEMSVVGHETVRNYCKRVTFT